MDTTTASSVSGEPQREYTGACACCRRPHRFRNDGEAAVRALNDLFSRIEHDTELLDLRAALGASRGKMVGVLVGVDDAGGRHVLRAFSGDLGGRSAWPGWAASVMVRSVTATLEEETLARLGRIEEELRRIAAVQPPDGATPRVARRITGERERAVQELKTQRRRISATLMSAMFDGMRLMSARGEERPLRDVFVGRGIPSGTTECVVPRLLHAANVARVRAVGIAEAWWGPTLNDRRHGDLQAPCTRKCLPILGHLLCGLDDP